MFPPTRRHHTQTVLSGQVGGGGIPSGMARAGARQVEIVCAIVTETEVVAFLELGRIVIRKMDDNLVIWMVARQSGIPSLTIRGVGFGTSRSTAMLRRARSALAIPASLRFNYTTGHLHVTSIYRICSTHHGTSRARLYWQMTRLHSPWFLRSPLSTNSSGRGLIPEP